ncbi:MAG: gliding motility-associated protein GldE [Candidatus Cyclobacteriaceae bacterium M2_1C_046]
METTLDEPPSQLLAQILNGDSLFIAGSLLILLLLLCVSALVSGSEVAFFSLSANDINECKESEKSNDKKILYLVTKPKHLLATILILNNFVNVAIVTLATFATWEITGSRTTEGTVVAVLTVTVSLSIIFFGEVMPKVYATQNNLHLARITAGALKGAEVVLRPLSYPLMSMSGVIEKRFQKRGYDISVEELHQALEITTKGEETTEEEKDILKGIVNFSTLTVKQIMKSRMDITAFDIEMDFHELMDKINKSGYSRVPVYNETIDNIEGLLYVKDLLPFISEEEHFQWQKLLRQGFFVPETKKIDSLLKDFQEKRVHMAIVVDEYGGTSGLITLEDIIEEIVGEINDEFDEDEIAYNKLDESTYIFEGKTSLNDFCKVTEVNPGTFEKVKGESESLGGLLLEIHNKLPNAGEKIIFDRFVFTVVSVDQRRIKRIRVFLKEEPQKDEDKFID